MIEVQILAAVIILGILIAGPKGHFLKGFGLAFLWIAGILVALLLISLLMEKVRDLIVRLRSKNKAE